MKTLSIICLADAEAYPVLTGLLEYYRAEAGLTAALALARHYGGVSVYLPNPDYLTAEHRLVKQLGLAAAKSLCRNFGPGEVEVPLGPMGAKPISQEIRRLGKIEGLTRQQIARKLGTTDRHVRRILNGDKDDKNQLKLFEE